MSVQSIFHLERESVTKGCIAPKVENMWRAKLILWRPVCSLDTAPKLLLELSYTYQWSRMKPIQLTKLQAGLDIKTWRPIFCYLTQTKLKLLCWALNNLETHYHNDLYSGRHLPGRFCAFSFCWFPWIVAAPTAVALLVAHFDYYISILCLCLSIKPTRQKWPPTQN